MSLAQNASPLNDDYMLTRRSFGGMAFAGAFAAATIASGDLSGSTSVILMDLRAHAAAA